MLATQQGSWTIVALRADTVSGLKAVALTYVKRREDRKSTNRATHLLQRVQKQSLSEARTRITDPGKAPADLAAYVRGHFEPAEQLHVYHQPEGGNLLVTEDEAGRVLNDPGGDEAVFGASGEWRWCGLRHVHGGRIGRHGTRGGRTRFGSARPAWFGCGPRATRPFRAGDQLASCASGHSQHGRIRHVRPAAPTASGS